MVTPFEIALILVTAMFALACAVTWHAERRRARARARFRHAVRSIPQQPASPADPEAAVIAGLAWGFRRRDCGCTESFGGGARSLCGPHAVDDEIAGWPV